MEISVACAVTINPEVCLDSKPLSRSKDYRKAQKPGGLQNRWAQCKFRKECQRNGLCDLWHKFQYLGGTDKAGKFPKNKRQTLPKQNKKANHSFAICEFLKILILCLHY